jgi:hypothetical protein
MFTNENYPHNEPVPVLAPEEITLAQLVTHYILPAGYGNLDSNTVFVWRRKLVQDRSRSGLKKTVKLIPEKIPAGYKLPVMANTLHTSRDRKQVTCVYGAAKIRFSFLLGETLERLSAAVVAEMITRGQGNQWFIEGNPREEIDFDYEYPILPIPQSEEVNIFLKQIKKKVKISDSWISLSDKSVQELSLPRGTLFRIYPVDMDIQHLGDDDHSYSFDWQNDQQYWFDIVHDHAKDPHDLCHQVRMMDSIGNVESSVVPGAAQQTEIAALWSKVIGFPENARLICYTYNNETCRLPGIKRPRFKKTRRLGPLKFGNHS